MMLLKSLQMCSELFVSKDLVVFLNSRVFNITHLVQQNYLK